MLKTMPFNYKMNECINYVLKREGGFENDSEDPGGATNFGISLRFLRSLGLKYDLNHDGVIDESDIKELTVEMARDIYETEFWNSSYDKLKSTPIVCYVFDMAVNMGAANSHKCLQRAICDYYETYDLIRDDGVLNQKTIDSSNRSGYMLLPCLIAERCGYYRSLVKENPHLDKFLNGWIERAYRTNSYG